MAEPRIKSLSTGKELNKDELYKTYMKQFPEEKITPDQVWQMHADKPDQFQVVSGQGYFGQMLDNVFPSAVRMAGGIAGMVNPETYIGLGKTAKGLVMDQFIPEAGRTESQQENVAAADAMKEIIRSRYAHPLETLKNDPVGATVELASIPAVAARGASLGARMTGSPALMRFSRGASAFSDVMNPMAWPTAAVRQVTKRTSLPERVYASTVAPLTEQTVADFDNTVTRAVRQERQVAGRKGIAETNDKAHAIDRQFDQFAQDAEARGLRFDPMRTATNIDESIGKAYGINSPNARNFPAEYVGTLDARKREYLTAHGATFDPKTGQMLTPPTDVSPTDARKLWKGANVEIGEVVSEPNISVPAKAQSIRDARRAVVDTFRNDWFPNIPLKGMGDHEAFLIDLRKMFEQETKKGVSPNHAGSAYALAHTGQVVGTMHASPIALATFAKHGLGPENISRIALKLAHKYPAIVRQYATPAFVASVYAAEARNRQGEPPTPQNIRIDGDWMTQVPEAHQ